MTVQPTAKKKSAAQVAAGKSFAAGGRSAQAKARAATVAKTGKPPPVSKARHQAALKWAAAGRASQAAKKAGKKPPAAKKKAALPVTMFSWLGPQIWLTGCNDERPTCAAVAVANSLLAITGFAAPDRDIMELHELAGGDDGATIETVLNAAAVHGLNGIRLGDFFPADGIGPGLVCGIQTRRGYHAVLSHEFGMISWGMLLSHSGELREQWALEWITHDAGRI